MKGCVLGDMGQLGPQLELDLWIGNCSTPKKGLEIVALQVNKFFFGVNPQVLKDSQGKETNRRVQNIEPKIPWFITGVPQGNCSEMGYSLRH